VVAGVTDADCKSRVRPLIKMGWWVWLAKY
jgi:hypothetical protein